MYKIYFNNKPLYLVSELNAELEEYLHHEDTVFIDDFNQHTVKAMIHEMEAPQIHAGVFKYDDVEALMKAFRKKLVVVQAAGGLVHTPTNEILLIHRRGKWDLPKGKLDPDEDLAVCAEREIKEETGLQKLKLEKPLLVTYHTYHEFGKHILKESHWFLFHSEKQASFLPQVEEDIDRCEWVGTDQLATYMENTHASVLDVVNAGLKELRESKNL
ncbi:MAG TPA: NUDIX domain-containing protein [Flavisolibacter sp.]